MIIKVCGITDQESISSLEQIGIDMIGLNFYPKSQRYLPKDHKISTYNRPESINIVGVFVNEKISEIEKLATAFSLSYIQLHGDETPKEVAKIAERYKLIKAFGLSEEFDFSSLKEYSSHCEYFIFDTRCTTYGGSGTKFNWGLLDHYTEHVPFLLSGGIGPEDVTDILSIKHPQFAGVDINSRFEISPGKKDLQKIETFYKSILIS